MDLETAQTNTTAKLPLLKQGEYDMWKLRIKQYFQIQEYALYDGIENGNSFKPAAQTTTNADGSSTTLIPHRFRRLNKPDLDTMSFDDLYNNFKIVEQEVKGTTSSSSRSSSQNLAFVSSTRSTNEVNTAYGVSTANTQVSTASTQVSTANLSDDTVYAFLASQPNGSHLVHEDLEQIHEDDLEEMDLKWQLALLSIRTRKFFQKTATYKRGLASVEEQLVFYKKNEVLFCEQLAILKRDISYKDSEISVLKSELEKLKHEKESNQLKIENFDNASKRLFSPPNLDLSYSGLKEFQQPELEGYGPKTSKSVSEDTSNEVRESPDASLVEELVSNDKLEKKIVFPTVAKINFVRPQQQEKLVRKPVKYAEMYRLTAITIKWKGWPKVVNTARPNSAVVNAVRENQGHLQKEDQGYVDSGCSRHMAGNMSYLLDFKEFDGGYVTFRGGAKEKNEPIPNVADEAVYEEWDDRVERAINTAASLDTEQASGNINRTQSTVMPNVPLPQGISVGGSPRVNTFGSDEGSMTLQELTVLCTTLSKKVESLEGDLKQTKKVYGAAYTKLIKNVKKLKKTVKSNQARRRAKIVVSDDEEDLEDSSKQGRKIEEIDQDVGVTLVTPTHSQEDQPEDQLGVFSAAKVLADAAKENVHTYTRRRRAVGTSSGGISTASSLFSTAEESVSTASASMPVSIAGMVQMLRDVVEFLLSAAKVLADAAKENVHTYTRRRRAVSTGSGRISTASRLFSTAEESVSTAGASMPVSTAGMVQEVNISIPSPVVVKDKGKGKMEESEDERTKRTKLQQEQEELDKEERQRMAKFHEAAQSFTKEEWETLEQELKLMKSYLGDYKQRKGTTEAKRNKPMTQAQQRNYMINYIKHIESHTLQQLKIYSFDKLKELFEITMKNVNTFVPIETEDRGRASELAAGSSPSKHYESAKLEVQKGFRKQNFDHEGFKRQKTNEHQEQFKQLVRKEKELSQEDLQ
ncbi:hypothetical protein Tco_0871801 [Tanacetum coccineum]